MALAYPPEGAAGEAAKLETIPTNGQGPINVTHGDLHSGNIMIGTTNPKIAEHSLVPAAKFIDLGETTENNERGLTENLYKISVVRRVFPGPICPHDSYKLYLERLS